jgi:hypothetical protein
VTIVNCQYVSVTKRVRHQQCCNQILAIRALGQSFVADVSDAFMARLSLPALQHDSCLALAGNNNRFRYLRDLPKLPKPGDTWSGVRDDIACFLYWVSAAMGVCASLGFIPQSKTLPKHLMTSFTNALC